MSVPFEDPLLHPPTPPIPPAVQQAAPAQDENEEDRPIPFQDNAASAPVATPFFLPSHQTQLPPPPPPPQHAKALASSSVPSSESSPSLVQDPLGAFSSGPSSQTPSPAPDGRASNRKSVQRPLQQLHLPSAAIHNVTTTSMPTEMPTQLTSPPIPQRPAVPGSSGFSAFQAFASPLQPPTTSNTPITGLSGESESEQGDRTEDDNNGGRSNAQQSQGSLLSGLLLGQQDTTVANADSSSLGIRIPGTTSTGVGAKISIQERADLIQQDLKSPPPQPQQPQDHQLPIPSQQPQPHLSLSGIQSPPHDRTRFGMAPQVSTPTRAAFSGSTTTSAPSSIRPERLPVLNSPTMFHDIHMTDSMNEIMSKHVPPERFVPRNWNAFTEAEQRHASQSEILQELTINNSWMAMARYARSRILSTPADQILKLINLWYVRLMALVQLGQYEMARAEFDQLGDLRGPLYRFENYPPEMFSDISENERLISLIDGGGRLPVQRQGCMVPFEMLVLQAKLPGYMGDAAESIDQLYDLIIYCKKCEATCRANKDVKGVQQWHAMPGQLQLLVLNYLMELKDYPLATRHAHDLARQYPGDINLHSGLGRMYLQLGDLEQAAKVFEDVEAMVDALSGSPNYAPYSLQVLMNKAFLAVSHGQWVAAKHAFEQVLKVEPENLAVSNNLAACELYMGMLNEAIPRLQGLMFAYPTSAGISEPLVFNLATLYELRSDGSLAQKQQLMLEVSKWAGDHFNTSMFKL